MADKKFGVKQIDLIGASGTPNLTSPNNLNLNAVTVAISTDVTIGGQVTSNIIVGTGKSIGIGTTIPTGDLDVRGQTNLSNVNVSGVSTFAGIATVTGSLFSRQLSVSGVTTIGSAVTSATLLRVSGIATFREIRVGTTTLTAYVNDDYSNTLSFGNVLYVYNVSESGSVYNLIDSQNRDTFIGISTATGAPNYMVGILTATPFNPDVDTNNHRVALGYGNDPYVLETTGFGVTVAGTIKTNQLVVSGIGTIDSLTIAQNSVNGTGNLKIGDTTTLGSNSGANYNLAIGQAALDNINNGDYNIAIGYQAGQILNISDSNYGNNVLVGYQAFANMRASNNNVAVGYRALYGAVGTFDAIQMTALGAESGYSLRNSRFSSFFGYQSGYNQTSADYNTFLGYKSGYNITTGSYNVVLGSFTGNQNGLDITTSSNNVVLSDGAGNIRLYANSSGNVGIGTTNATSKLTVSGDVNISGIVTATTFVGNFSGSITNATNLTGGYANASQLNVTGVTTISAGRIQADASSNLRFGNLAAGSGSSRNIAIGDQVLYSLSGGLGRNIGIGELSYYDTTSGQYNIGLGIQAGQKITTGSYNVIIGGYDGLTPLDLRTSSNNVVIADGQGNIRQYINSSGNVGIKTTTASEALTVAGVVSATSFYGTLNAGQLTGVLPAIDGSNLFGVTAAGSGIQIRDDGVTVGTAATVDFGTGLSVSFGSGIATVSGASSVSAATTAYSLAGTPNLNVGIVTATRLVSSGASLTSPLIVGLTTATYGIRFADDAGSGSSTYVVNIGTYYIQGFQVGAGYWQDRYLSLSNNLNYILPNVGIGTTNATSKLTVSGDINATGVVTASSFSGSGANLTNLPAGQLTGTLPAIDGSALLNVNATGSGIVVLDNDVNVGSAKTVNFGTGLDVTYSASGIATISASGGSLQSRTIVAGITTSIANNGIGNTDITGFKSYALMKVGLSTAGWLRLYTDSTSRANDATRSVGIDPTPGSGVIAEVVTTGISTTQIISPFVMGGNLNNPADTTIYAAITNLSGVTSSISVNLTLLQLEA